MGAVLDVLVRVVEAGRNQAATCVDDPRRR